MKYFYQSTMQHQKDRLLYQEFPSNDTSFIVKSAETKQYVVHGFNEEELAIVIDDTLMLMSLPPQLPVRLLVLKTAEPSREKTHDFSGLPHWRMHNLPNRSVQ